MSNYDVYEAPMSIPSRGFSQIEGMPNKLIKSSAMYICPSLCTILNRCIREARFPALWKHSIVTPIPKISKPQSPADFRPIALTSTFAKLLEKIVKRWISNSTVPCAAQHGFVRRRSTISCLVSMHSRICGLLAERKSSKVASVFFDLKKAFDSVPHNLLLYKLDSKFHVNSHLLCMVRSFIVGRSQQVRVGKCISEDCVPTSGVPQGSVLGPTLFSCFIDDASELVFSDRTELFLYADDVVIVKPIYSQKDYIDLQGDINILEKWCLDNFFIS